MNCKSILVVLLMLSVFFNCGCEDANERRQPSNESATRNTAAASNQANEQDVAAKPSDTIIAYYFHRTFRCPSCLAIEALSLQALQSDFGPLLDDGSLEWLPINIDEPDGEKFVKDFDLEFSCLTVVKMRNGQQVRWKNLDKVWELKDDRDAFVKYVQDEVAAYLTGD